jgi:hypothetical protein
MKPAIAAVLALVAAAFLAACEPKAGELKCEGGVEDISRLGDVAPPVC